MVRSMAKRAKRARRRIEDVVQYALGHRTRVYILILLNEGIYTAAELAAMMDEPLNNVHKHLGKDDPGAQELLSPGSRSASPTPAATGSPTSSRWDFSGRAGGSTSARQPLRRRSPLCVSIPMWRVQSTRVG